MSDELTQQRTIDHLRHRRAELEATIAALRHELDQCEPDCTHCDDDFDGVA